MVDEILHSFLEYDGEEKNAEWASEKVKVIMMNATVPLMDELEYRKGEEILYGKFPDVDLKKLFKGKTMEGYKDRLSDTAIFLFEKARNAMIDDRTQAGLTCYVNSLDPDKEEKREQDKNLLKNRKGIEALMNDLTDSNGMPPTKFEGDDFNGNIDEFDKAGGDDLDDDDIDEFFEHSWGLKQEIFGQKVLNVVTRQNQIERYFDKYINSILISLHVCSQAYVNDTTGSIRNEFLYPYQVFPLNSTGSNDFKDAQGFRIPKQNNVRGFLREFGGYFDFENDWSMLLASSGRSEYNTDTRRFDSEYTGFTDRGQVVFGNNTGKTINFRDVLDLPIAYEYAEWKSITKIRKQYVVTELGNIMPMTVDKNTPPVDGVSVEEKTFEETYYAYYLTVGSLTPKLIKWGKVYMQPIEGFNDEYSGFTIKVNKRDGAPMAEILRPFHQLMNVSFKMFEMLVNDIKPDGWWINYTSLTKIAQYLQTAKDAPADTRSAIDDYLKMINESPNALTDNPETEDGQPMGGGNMAILPKKNGLNEAANELVKIMDWIEVKVQKYTSTDGINPTDPRDGFKVSLENKKRSRQSTAFIDFILLAHLEDISITNLNYALDISKHKSTPAYKYLEASCGYKTMDFLASMKKAPHRYGTFIDTFNNDLQLTDMKAMAVDEYRRNTLPLDQMLKVISFDSVKDAIMYLSKEKRKAAKKAQQDQMGIYKQQDANAQAAFEREMKLEELKGQWQQKSRQEQSKGFVDAANINSTASLQRENIKSEGQNERLAKEAQNEIDMVAERINKQQQAAVKV